MFTYIEYGIAVDLMKSGITFVIPPLYLCGITFTFLLFTYFHCFLICIYGFLVNYYIYSFV